MKMNENQVSSDFFSTLFTKTQPFKLKIPQPFSLKEVLFGINSFSEIRIGCSNPSPRFFSLWNPKEPSMSL